MSGEIAPRLLKVREAAEYLSLPMAQFERLRIGLVRLGAAVRYDRMALDAYLDELGGLGAKSDPTQPDEAEAALARFNARRGHAAGRP